MDLRYDGPTDCQSCVSASKTRHSQAANLPLAKRRALPQAAASEKVVSEAAAPPEIAPRGAAVPKAEEQKAAKTSIAGLLATSSLLHH